MARLKRKFMLLLDINGVIVDIVVRDETKLGIKKEVDKIMKRLRRKVVINITEIESKV